MKSIVGDRAHVVTIAVAYENVEQVRQYVRDHDVRVPVLLGDDATERAFRVSVFPTVYFVDASGQIMRSASGYTTTAGLLARLYAP